VGGGAHWWLAGVEKKMSEVQLAQDSLPEFQKYHDSGCSLASACLECPFPECVSESLGGIRYFLKENRDKEIRRLHLEGKTIKSLASLYSVHARTITRALR